MTEKIEHVKHETLAEALAAFQAEIPTVRKGNHADVQGKDGKRGYSYDYADLTDVTEVAMPLLGKHGLSFSAKPTVSASGDFALAYVLRHESGESDWGEYPLPPANTPAQTLGGAITYARRYAFTAVTGVAPGGDDDDAQASNDIPAPARRRAPQAVKPASPQPVQPAAENWAARIVDVKTVEDLRGVHKAAGEAGELGRPLNPEFSTHLEGMVQLFGLDKPSGAVTVGQAISAVKTALEKREEEVLPLPGEDEVGPSGPPADDGPAAVLSWETATPGGEPS